MGLAIGIDLGGTDMKVGVLNGDGVLADSARLSTRAHEGPGPAIARLSEHIRAITRSNGEVCAIGVGAPGPIDRERGVLLAAPNLPGWENLPLCALLRENLGIPTRLENDANAAAYGEYFTRRKRGESVSSMALFTIGTGVGGGIVLDDRLVRGAFGSAGEVGHLIVDSEGRDCPCGQRGCLERYASATAISELFTQATGATGVSAREICEQAAGGDPAAAAIIDQAARFLAIAIITLQHLVNPELVALGGGVAGAGAVLLDPVRRWTRTLTWKLIDDAPRIELATAGNDAGMIGAASLARCG